MPRMYLPFHSANSLPHSKEISLPSPSYPGISMCLFKTPLQPSKTLNQTFECNPLSQ